MIQTSFLELVAAGAIAGILAKLASLAIDALLWLRSWCVALVAEAGKKRKPCR